MPGGGATTTASSSPNSSHTSLPGGLSNALSWTLQRWNSASSTRPPSTSASSVWGTGHHSTSHEKDYLNSNGSLPPSAPSSRPPSRRRASPFQPPPLPPLGLHGYSESTTTHILTPTLAEEIRQLIPPRLQLYETWSLAYSLEQHGVSLATLYERCAMKQFQKGGFVLVIKDDVGSIFGAFANEAFKISGGRYYGTGECFLWKANWVKSYASTHYAGGTGGSNGHRSHHHRHHLHPAHGSNRQDREKENSWDQNNRASSVEEHSSRASTPVSISSDNVLKFRAFPYSGVNEYMILCEQNFLSVGGGNGKYGLWLDDVFEKGVSSPCLTFGNEALSDDGEKFEVIGVEVWSIGGSSF